jgi:hypothetical protein
VIQDIESFAPEEQHVLLFHAQLQPLCVSDAATSCCYTW